MLSESSLLDGCAIGGAISCAPILPGGGTRTSLQFVVYHFFLERAPSDKDAITDLTDFVQCLQLCCHDSFEVELFCSFLDGRRSLDDLCFLLWVLQVINDTEVGISYDDCAVPPVPLASGNNKQLGNEHVPRFVCLLKATFVARATFRLLRFKSASTTASSTSTTSVNGKGRPSTAPSRSASSSSLLKPSSPLSPSKRRIKSRTGDELLGERSKSQLKLVAAEVSSESAADQATAALRNAIKSNSRRPVTLEVFNQLLAQFALAPSTDELISLLGPFYHATGDERKLPWEVFIALLLEMYRHQSKWQREQLRALFMHLHWQAEMDERAAAKKKAEELALLAATTKKRAGAQSDATKEEKKKKKKPKKRPLVQGELESGGEPWAKYLRGLTRPLLSELLRTSGIIENQTHVDIDWMFVRVLDVANVSAAEIRFDAVYDALRSLRLLPDWSRQLQTMAHGERIRNYRPEEFAPALQAQWRGLASVSLALCENDPNVFVRKQSQRWLQRIDSHIVRLSKLPLDIGGSTPWHVIESIRAMLSYAWRLASKRSCDSYLWHSERSSACTAVGTCFTEFYFADQTVRATIDSLTGFSEPAAAASVSPWEANDVSATTLHGSLERFYKTSMMRLEPYLVASTLPGVSAQLAPDSESLPTLHVQLEHVLQRYAVHFAYLYARYKTAAFNCSSGVALHQWRQMAYELSLVHPSYLPPSRLQELFLRVLNSAAPQQENECTTTLEIDDLALNQTQFVELFVVVAFELHRGVVGRHRKHRLLRGPSALSSSSPKRDGPQIDDIWRPLLSETGDRGGNSHHHPAQVLSLFVHELVTRMAIRHRATPHEVGFSQKLSCPLVGRALLEHRAFLRSVFFYYAKQDEDAADMLAASQLSSTPRFDDQLDQSVSASPQLAGSDLELKKNSSGGSQADANFQFQLEKTKRNSMSFDEFQMFLGEFDLLRGPNATPPPGIAAMRASQPILSLEDAQRVFQTVMSVDNDDVSQLEFDEFAGAIVALAVFFAPDPFTLWHEKIHAFVSNLKSRMREDDVRLQY